ncbi:hypothetical protein Tco_0018775 [Tanacetum coccineum]
MEYKIKKRVWFEVELQGVQGDCEAKDFYVSKDDAVMAQRRLEKMELKEKKNTDCLVNEQEEVHPGIKVGEDITITEVPGQEGLEGNVAERKKRRSKEAKLENILKYKTWIDQEEVFVVRFFWKEQEGSILFRLPDSPHQKFLMLRLNIGKLDGNIVQKHGGSKQVGFKQLGPSVETGVYEVHDEKHVWFEVELQGAQGDRKTEVFQVSNDDTAVAQRKLKDKQPKEKTNTDCLVKEQEKEYQTGWKIKTGIQQQNGLVDETNVTLFAKIKKPIDMLGFFGWLASIKQWMLEPVKVKCIFLGYHKSIVGNKLWRLDDVTSKVVLYMNIGFNESGEYNKTFISSGVGMGSMQVLYGFEFEVEPLRDHTFEVEPQENVDQGAGLQEVQTQDLMDYQLVRDRDQHFALEKIYAHKSLTFNKTFACEVISKWKVRLKDDMDARSDIYVLSDGCKKCSNNNNGYYWEYTQAEIWATKGLLDKAKRNVLGMEFIKDQSGNTLRVSQSKFYNRKLVQTLLEGHSILSLEDSLLGDDVVEKNGKWSHIYAVGSQEYQMVCTRLDITSADVGMLDKFYCGLQTDVQVFMNFDYAMGRSITVIGIMEMELDFENMTIKEYLEYEAEIERRLRRNLQSKRSLTKYEEANFDSFHRNKSNTFNYLYSHGLPPPYPCFLLVLKMAQQIIPAAQLVPKFQGIRRCNNYDVLQSIPCLPEYKIVGQILHDHPLSYDLTATVDVPALDTQEITYIVDMFRATLQLPVETLENPFVVPATIEIIKSFMHTVSYQGVVDKVSALFTKNLAQPWQTMFKVFNRCLTTHTFGHDQTKINILQLFHDVINQTNVDYAALLLLEDDYHSIKDDIPLIRATNDYKEYEMVFINVDVSMNQPQPIVSTQGTHRDEIAEATLLSLALHKTSIAAKAQENVAKVQEKLAKEEIEKMLKGEEDDESYASEFADSMLNDDVDDSGTRIESRSHKENPKVVVDDDVNDKQKQDESKDDNGEKTDDAAKEKDNDDQTDHTLIRTHAMSSMETRNEHMQTPIPTPTRSLRKDLSSDKIIS